MIPAEARWVIQNIYLPTTNCSSFSQLGIKDCLLLRTHFYISFFFVFVFFLSHLGEKYHAQPFLSFSRTTKYFCCSFRAETMSFPLSYRRLCGKKATRSNSSFCTHAEKSALNKAVGTKINSDNGREKHVS